MTSRLCRRFSRKWRGPKADQIAGGATFKEAASGSKRIQGLVGPPTDRGIYFLARVRRSPLGVRQRGPLGHSRRSINSRPIRRDFISGSILGCAGVPSTAASAVNSVLVRARFLRHPGTIACPKQGVCPRQTNRQSGRRRGAPRVCIIPVGAFPSRDRAGNENAASSLARKRPFEVFP
jgi:hypothetical protein